ncbi:MAG: hypothetical protein ACK4F9_01290 [Brevinematia bacterium]
MKVLIIGDSDVVEILVSEFIKNNVDIYLISTESIPLATNFEKVDNYSELGKSFFEDKEIDSFDKCIISLSEKNILDMINISTILLELGADVLAILPNKKYKNIFSKLGIDHIIPSYDVAFRTVGEIMLKFGPVESVIPFIEDYFITKINISPDSKICNKKVSELDLRNKFNINIILAFRKEFIMLEKGVSKTFVDKVDIKANTTLTSDMSIVVVGPFDSIRKFIDYLYET